MGAAAASTELMSRGLFEKSYLQDLLEHAVDPNTQDNQGLTALWSASWVGREDQVRMLLEWRADPNMVASSGLAALHNAARKGHVDLAKVLLDHRADIDLQDKQGNTPLMWAIQHNQPEVAVFILDSGARSKLMRALQLARRLQYEPFVTMIMDRFSEEEVEKTNSMCIQSSIESASLTLAVVRARRVSKRESRGMSTSLESPSSPMLSEMTRPSDRFSMNVEPVVVEEPANLFNTDSTRSSLSPIAQGPPKPSVPRKVGFQINGLFRNRGANAKRG